jgi:hypothetical protein
MITLRQAVIAVMRIMVGLDSYHTFSVANYYDRSTWGFGRCA